jgi:cytidylate kinase
MPPPHPAPDAGTAPRGLIIAIDGPAASGKSSTARAVAAALGYRHLDSGAFYRALTRAALERGIPVEQWPGLTRDEIAALAISSEPHEAGYRLRIAGEVIPDEALRTAAVNAHVSPMACVPAVRDWLFAALREAGKGGGLVADGRDIGTVVFPEAGLKVFLTASPEARARRRLIERGHAAPSEAEVRAEAERLASRDRIDSTRAIAPLRQDATARLIDTSELDFTEQVGRIVQLAQQMLGRNTPHPARRR